MVAGLAGEELVPFTAAETETDAAGAEVEGAEVAATEQVV